MTFDEWLQHKRDAGEKPFGTAYEIFAKAAWNAAIEEAAKHCETLGDESRRAYSAYGECAESLRLLLKTQ